MRLPYPRDCGRRGIGASGVEAPADGDVLGREAQSSFRTQIGSWGRKEVWSLVTKPTVSHRMRTKLERGNQREMNGALDLRDRQENQLSCTKTSFLSIKTQQGQKMPGSVTSCHLTQFGSAYLAGITLAGWLGAGHRPVGSQPCTLPSDRTGYGEAQPRQRALVSMETGWLHKSSLPGFSIHGLIHLNWGGSQSLEGPGNMTQAPVDCLPLCSEHEFRGLRAAQEEPDPEPDEAREA